MNARTLQKLHIKVDLYHSQAFSMPGKGSEKNILFCDPTIPVVSASTRLKIQPGTHANPGCGNTRMVKIGKAPD